VLFGLALGTKWNSIFVLAAMGVLSVLWDVGARRLAGSDWRSWFALLADGGPAFVRLVIVSALDGQQSPMTPDGMLLTALLRDSRKKLNLMKSFRSIVRGYGTRAA